MILLTVDSINRCLDEGSQEKCEFDVWIGHHVIAWYMCRKVSVLYPTLFSVTQHKARTLHELLENKWPFGRGEARPQEILSLRGYMLCNFVVHES